MNERGVENVLDFGHPLMVCAVISVFGLDPFTKLRLEYFQGSDK
jgi:hypothetical protein